MINEELMEKYPFLVKKIDDWSGMMLSEDEISYDNNWWDDIPEGWANAFGEEMCNELLEILNEANYVDEYCIVQIKEKFAGLRLYDNGVPESIRDKYYAWLNKYEQLSYKTCIKCGSPATRMTKGWVVPLCDTCYNELYSER